MQLSLAALLTASVITAVAAIPAPAPTYSTPTPTPTPSACTGGSYEKCMADVVCIQSWPDSCYCQKAASERCAAACGITAPAMTCPPKIPDACQPKVCTMNWPESCHCQVDQKKECALAKGEVFDEAEARKKCGPRRSEPKPASNPCEPKVCIMSWPDSCNCEVDQRRDCALSRGLPWDDAKERAKCQVAATS